MFLLKLFDYAAKVLIKMLNCYKNFKKMIYKKVLLIDEYCYCIELE